jgi:hypothetical protein
LEGTEREIAKGGEAPGLTPALVLFTAYVAARGWRAEEPLLVAAAPLLLAPAARRWAALFALAFYLAPGIGRLTRAPFAAANHEYLEAFLLLLVALLPGRDPAGRAHLRRALGLALVAVVLASGVQKAAHGSYPRGEFFEQSFIEPTKFAAVLDRIVPEEDRASARAYRAEFERFRREARAGVLEREPPRPALVSAVSIVACWATLLAEIAGPLLLLLDARRRRLWAALLLAFFAAVEAAAAEWMFGALVAILLVPFLAERPGTPPPPPLARRAAAALALLCIWPLAHIGIAFATDLSPWKLGGFGMYAIPARWGAIAVETRAPGEPLFRPRPPRDEREHARFEHAGYVLRNVPFAAGAARDLAARVRAAEPPGAPPLEVRVRVTTIRWDRRLGRHRADERSWTPPSP